MEINWCVNIYVDKEGIKERVDKVSFGDSYENAQKYYLKHKAKERKQGRYLELTPYKVQ